MKNLKKICSFILSVNLISLSNHVFAMNYRVEEKQNDLVAGFSEKNAGFDERASILPTAGKHSLLNFLLLAVYPIGLTLYTWGGGWNEQDDGAGVSARTIGLRKSELEFARMHFCKNIANTEADEEEVVNNEKDYVKVLPTDELGNSITLKNGKKYMYKYIHKGKDCSGFVGWVVYNTLNKENDQEGYVISSTKMAEFLFEKEFGTVETVTKNQINDNTYQFYPGDIVSIQGHVYISLGQCEDGSILLVHSTNPGVCIMGTTTKDGNVNSKAVKIAQKCNEQYPIWNEWYNNHSGDKNKFTRDFSKYTKGAKIFRWSINVLEDSEGVRTMSPEQVVNKIFPNLKIN